MNLLDKLSKKEQDMIDFIDIENMVVKPEVILKDVKELVEKYNINHIDALLLFCDKNMYDVESVCKIIPASLRSQIEDDARNLKLLKKDMNTRSKLPI